MAEVGLSSSKKVKLAKGRVNVGIKASIYA
jgi:hypothetical protein